MGGGSEPVFTDVFRTPTEHGVAYELSTTEPTPAIARILDFASEIRAAARRRRFDLPAQEGIVVYKPKPGAKKGCLLLLAATVGFGLAAASALRLLAATL